MTKTIDIRTILGQPLVYRLFWNMIAHGDTRALHARENIRAAHGDRILDIGCGPGDVLDSLPSVDYHGFDLNQSYIDFATRHYAGRGKFYCQRVEKTFLPGDPNSFDIVIANGILHHLSDSEAGDLFALARHALKPGGRLVTFEGCYAEGQNKFARYLLSRDRGDYVRTADGYLALAAKAFSRIEHKIYDSLLRLPYTHIVLNCTA